MAKKKAVKKKTAKSKPAKKKKVVKKSAPPPPPEDIEPGDLLTSFPEIAEEFGVSYDTVKNWRRCGMPGQQGSYSRTKISNWVKINGKGVKSIKRTTKELENEAIEAAALEQIGKAKKVAAEAAILERKNRTEQGGLVRRVDSERFLTAVFTELRLLTDRMVVDFAAGYGHKMQPQLREDLRARMDLMLNQLADWMEKLDDMEID